MLHERRDIGIRLLESEDRLADAFLATISREIPAYADLDEAQVAEVRSIIVWTLHRVLELWVEDGALTPEDIRLFRGVGAVRARDGRPLSAVLRAYRVGAVEFLDQVSEVLREDLCVEDMTSLVRVWFAVLDELSEAIYDGYESTGRSLGEDRESSLRALLADLVLGRQSHAATLDARLRELGAELPATFDLVVVGPTADVPAERAVALITATVESRPGRLITAIHTVLDGVGVALVRGMSDVDLRRVLTTNGLRAAHWTHVTARTAPRAYRLAMQVVRDAPEFAWSAGPVLVAGDMEVVALTMGHPDGDPARVAESVLGPLVTDALAVPTLQALARADGAAPAAQLLHVHPQTVRYRLRRVTALTGRDPRVPWHRYVFQTALMTGPSGADPHA